MKNLAGTARKNNPNQILGYMGCMAQSRGKELIEKLPDVDLVLGTQKFHRAANTWMKSFPAGAKKLWTWMLKKRAKPPSANICSTAAPRRPCPRLSASCKAAINTAPSASCPYTRGEERSRTIDDIVGECRELVSRGVREITLLGQIVTSFGKRNIPALDGKSAFVQLLDAVHEIDGLERIRFTSPHPKGYGDDLVEAYARLPKLCESAHIPLQSGSDRLLKLMHRGYTRERFLGIIEKLRRAKPGIGITTDIIVGFPRRD
ncbi:MAG: radical SAM protein [Limisphaerales bacterium]